VTEAFAAFACSDGTAPTPTSLDPVGDPQFSTSGGGQVKVEVCHRRMDGSYNLITIGEPGFDAHVAHGDAAPGEPVPGMPGYRFDDTCLLVPAVADQSSLTGKANFGFVSKYKKGATAPTGNTEFQFKTADLNFHSSSYDWLVVTGSDYAKFKGSGTINGMGDYRFMLWAGDDAPDTFRIRIWTEDQAGVETDVYDNGSDQAIGGGSIVIHTKK
jgi:hypothetical protein